MERLKRIVAGIVAFIMTLSPLQATLTTFATAVSEDKETPIEEVNNEEQKDTDELILSDPEDIIISELSDSIETDEEEKAEAAEFTEVTETAKPYDESDTPVTADTMETTQEPDDTDAIMDDSESGEIEGKITTAGSSSEYYSLVASLPEGYQRIIVDTYTDLNSLEVTDGVYYDGTYILVFDDSDTCSKAVMEIDDAGLEYAVDGIVDVCGDSVTETVDVNPAPDATVKIAVIDTGSNTANEAYSVIGDDVTDNNGHGTSMCSYILDETDNAYIISIKAIGDDGRGNISDVYAAVQMAEDMGVDYILMAISIRNTGRYDAFISLIENTKAAIVASAGNNGADASKYLPAGISSVITAGALNGDLTLRSDSNYGDAVDYYVSADSTSVAAAKTLGMIVDGRQAELAISPSEPESSSVEYTESQYYLAVRAEDDGIVFVTDGNSSPGNTITIYEPDAYGQTDLFSSGPDKYAGVFSSSDSADWNNNILYCVETTKEAPSGYAYSMYDWQDNTDPDEAYVGGSLAWAQCTQAACAFGPTGALYEYGVNWWKEHDTDGAIKNKYNETEMRKAMYVITHYICCAAYDYENDTFYFDTSHIPSSIWDSGLISEYFQYILSVRRGTTELPGVTLSGWWCEYYRCSEFNGDEYSNTFGRYVNNDFFQIVTRGGVTATTAVTVAKNSSTSTDEGYYSTAGAEYSLYSNYSKNNGVFYLEDSDRVATFVIGSDGNATSSYKVSQETPGYTYFYLKETKAPTGYALDNTIYRIWVYSDGRAGADVVPDSGSGTVIVDGATAKIVHVKDSPDRMIISLNKKLGTNYTILRGYSYNFELWDNTAGVKVADGVASTSSNATGATSTPVVWSNVRSGYNSLPDNRLDLIPSHTYQIMETTLSVGEIELEVPSEWTKGTVHGKQCFYYSFTSAAGIVRPFTATNSINVPLTITKTSANKTATDGNSSYSIAGAKYTLATSADLNTGVVGSFTMKADGTSYGNLNVNCGTTYYLKEITAGKGYELDDSVYKIVIAANGKATVSTYSGSRTATVTNGNPIVVHVADKNKTASFELSKKIDPGNSVILAGKTYSFILRDTTLDTWVATGSATVPAGADGSTTVPVEWIKISAAHVEKLSGTNLGLIFGHDYEIRETSITAGGRDLKVPSGWKQGTDYFYKTFTANADHSYKFDVTNDVVSADFSLTKKLGENYQLLAGKTYVFEFWDNTSGIKVADGKAAVPASATSASATSVLWSSVDTVNGYYPAGNNRLSIIPGHSYQIMETTMSVNSREIETPSGWTKGTAHGKSCFFRTFTANSGQTYSFQVTNSTTVPLSLMKQSSDPDKTNGNSSYSLEEARYVLSKDASFSDSVNVGSFTVKADGTSNRSLNVVCGNTYYLKETSAGTGYLIDTSVYKIVIGTDGKAIVSTYSGSGKVSVTQGNPILVNVKDKPKTTKLSVVKSSSDVSASGSMPNSDYDFTGTTYELYKNADLTGKAATFVMNSDGKTDTTFETAYGKTYYLKETKAGKGFDLDEKTYTVKVSSTGSISVSSGATADNSGTVKLVKVTDSPQTAGFGLSKQLGTNAPLLAGQSYSFEIWDNTRGVKVADGNATVPSTANSSRSTPVVWSNIAEGYVKLSGNQLRIIPGHTYQVMETTLSVNGRILDTPEGWTKGTAHGKTCFYRTFTASAGQTHAFSATNSLEIPLTITKASANTSITAGNNSYSFEGAKYILAKDDSFSDENTAGTFSLGSDGTADNTVNVVCGSAYYLKETAAGKGYLLDASVYKIVIGSDGTATVSTKSGSGKATVTQGNPILINVKDQPETTKITLAKSSSDLSASGNMPNSDYDFAGTTYELYKSADGTGKIATFVMKSDGKTDTAYETAYGKTYYLKETKAGKGFDLDSKTYTVKVSSTGIISVNNGASVDNGGAVRIVKVTDVPQTAEFSLNKQLGSNYQLLAGKAYVFELWDNTGNVKVADGKATVPANASDKTTSPVVWTNMASGYASLSNNRLRIIPGHTYQVMETTLSADGRSLNTPSDWTKGTAHGKTCFYRTFTASAGKTYSYTVVNSTSVKISLTKSSSDTGISDNNSSYDLAGTKYVLAKDASFSEANKLGTFSVKSDGSADKTLNVVCGNTYYLKETATGTGYAKDTSVYKIVIGNDGNAAVSTASGSGKASVTQGNPIIVRVKDKPETVKISIFKSSSDTSASGIMPNSDYDFAGTTYELYANSNGTGKVASFVMKSDGKTSDCFETAYGKTYYLKETKAGKGFDLDSKTYTVKVSSTGIISVNNGAVADNSGSLKLVKVKDVPQTAEFSLNKQLGTNASLLAGKTYSFELWDNTRGIKAASGTASVPADATNTTLTPVVWSDIASGYATLSGGLLRIIPGHTYQVMETTLSVNGRVLETPAEWTRGTVHGKLCFYRTFTANAGKTYAFSATNSTSVLLSIKKQSADAKITNGNSSYDMAGAKYVLAGDPSFTESNTVGTFTLKSDGSADKTLNVICGKTYYLKETVSGKGYLLDESVYKIVIGNDGNAVVSTESGSVKATVTQGNPVMINVKDKPETTRISLIKNSSDVSVSGTMPNSDYDFEGTTYELYTGSNGTGKAASFVMKSDGRTDTSFETAYGRTYYLKETKAGKGFDLDNKLYTITVGSDGKISVNNGADVDNSGTVKFVKVNDVPQTAKFSLNKKLGTNYQLLAGKVYVFELWDNTEKVKVADGKATVPSGTTDTVLTPVVWSDIAGGYALLSDNQLRIIPGHIYQVMETTLSVNGRVLETPADWTKGVAHGKTCFNKIFTAEAGKTYSFTAVNSTTVKLSIAKSSTNASLSDNNGSYSFEGAVYVLAKDNSFREEYTVGSITLRSDGTADKSLNVVCGNTYFLKETIAATGFKMDKSIYKIEIGPDGNALVSTDSGSGKAEITQGKPVIVNVKDQPKTARISIAKSSSDRSVSGNMPNSDYDLTGCTYELYTNADGTGKVAAFVLNSDGKTDFSYETAYGRTYYLKETKPGKGFDMDPEIYTVKVSSTGTISVNNGAAVDNGGVVKLVMVSDVPQISRFSLNKKLGTNASLLAGKTYSFELWDNTANVKVAEGKSVVSASADPKTMTTVIWSDIADGYAALGENCLRIIPGHRYQIMETTLSVNGRILETPSGWTKGTVHGKNSFYLTFTADAGQTHSFTATNSTVVKLSITKVSDNKSISDNNSSYNLAGAEYSLSADSGFSNVLGIFTVNSVGTADKSVNVVCGNTFYLKETHAATGFNLDKTVYRIDISPDGNASVSSQSGSGKATVTQGNPIRVNVKDQPKTTKISIAKESSDPSVSRIMPNNDYDIAGAVYELYTKPDGTGKVAEFVMNSEGKTGTSYETAYGKTYYLKETKAGKGFELDTKVYMVKVSSSGNISVNEGAQADNSGTVKIVKVTDAPKTAGFSLNKQLGINASLLAGKTYSFELWDNTADIKVADGKAKVPSAATSKTLTPVVWSNIATENGYALLDGNVLRIIPGHTYQILETTLSVNGRILKTPKNWTKGSVHGKTCFYNTFTADEGQMYSFTATNSTSVKLSLTKVSSNPDYSSGNKAYNLAGAEYVLAKEALFQEGNIAGTFTIKSDGTADKTLEVVCGNTYYLKETVAATGFLQDRSVYKIEVGADGNAAVSTYSGSGKASVTQGNPVIVNVTEVPRTSVVSLAKESANAKVTDNNSCYSLSGTVYGLYETPENAKADSCRLRTFTISDEGGSSDAFTSAYNRSYYLKEITAGKGYKLDENIYTVNVSSKGVVTASCSAGEVTVTKNGNTSYIRLSNQPQMASFRLNKKLGANYQLLSGYDYIFELWDKTSDIKVAEGKASVPGDTDSGVSCKVIWSDIASGYSSLPGNKIEIVPGHSYQIRETTQDVNGIKLDVPDGWTQGDGYFYRDFKAGTNKSYSFTAVNETSVRMSVKKASTNTAIVSANACYSLEGTTYGLYRKSNDELIHTFVLDQNGNMAPYSLSDDDGTDLYISEIKAGRGYKIDPAKHTVVLNKATDNLVTIKVKDEPVSGDISWTVVKRDMAGWNAVTGKTMSGAEFTVEYFDRTDIRTEEDLPKLNASESKVSVSLTTSQLSSETDGALQIDINSLAAADTSGYFNSFISLGALPLGTYRVTEKTAPEGYLAADQDKPVVFYIFDNDGTASEGCIYDKKIYKAVSSSEIVMKEPARVGFFAPSKLAADCERLITGLHSLDGTQYGIYYKENDLHVCTVTFNSDGEISNVEYSSGIRPSKEWKSGDKSIELAEGDYYAKELSSGKWFFVDGAEHEFSITANELTEMDMEDQPKVPEISTMARDADSGTHYLTYSEKVTVIDTVSYKGLVPDCEYTLTGTLYNAENGEVYKDSEGKTYTASVKFKPSDTGAEVMNGVASGTVDVTFADVAVPFEKTAIVVFEELYEDSESIIIAAHSDIADADQTVRRPSVSTSAEINNAKEIWLESTEERVITIVDTIVYSGLEPGSKYRAEATVCKRDGSEICVAGQPVISVMEFMPEASDGEIAVEISFTTEGLEEGDRIVVFEKIYDVATEDEIREGVQTKDILIASHEDLNSEDQTVTLHYRPMTGGIIPSYSVAGYVITVSAVVLGMAWFTVTNKRRRYKE
ncbi:MAG: VaFE repeat-containing surface-anchored protein [Saccharofermentans sp.]|nr:VaFE repeat-containing surface-anchored protein [Saccharofermentans sp.]